MLGGVGLVGAVNHALGLAEFDDADLYCSACPTITEHRQKCWYPCDEPERPLDDHALFDIGPPVENGCAGCLRAWKIYGCPIPADLLPAAR